MVETGEKWSRIAYWVSLITSAPIVAGLIYLWIGFTTGVYWFGLLGFVLGFFPPAVYVWFLLRRKIVDSWFVNERMLRIGPLLLSLTGFIILFLLSLVYGLRVFNMLSFAYVCNTIITLSITLQWKISIHMYGLTGPLTFLLLLYDSITWVWFLLVPIVAWARLKLRAHSLAQIIAGGVLGVLLTIIEVVVYNNLLFP